MITTKRNYNQPELTDWADITQINANFNIEELQLDGMAGVQWGGYIDSDTNLVEANKIYIDIRDSAQWLCVEAGEFGIIAKHKLSLGHLNNTKFDNVGEKILVGTDLNTLTVCGHYRCNSSSDAGTMLNTPFPGIAFTLVVDSITADTQYTSQVASKYSDGQIKTRVFDGIAWSSWEEILTSKSIIDNLVSTSTIQPLSANMGKTLQDTKLTQRLGANTGSNVERYVKIASIAAVVGNASNGLSLLISGMAGFGNTLITNEIINISSRNYSGSGAFSGISGITLTASPNYLSTYFAVLNGDRIELWIDLSTYNYNTYVSVLTTTGDVVLEIGTPTTVIPSNIVQTFTPRQVATTDNPPVQVSGVLVMADGASPVDKYPGTTWSIVYNDKYLRGGDQSNFNVVGGSNSITIGEDNLPTTIGVTTYGNFPGDGSSGDVGNGQMPMHDLNGGGGTYTSGAFTLNLGSGSSLIVAPEYQRPVFWKRVS